MIQTKKSIMGVTIFHYRTKENIIEGSSLSCPTEARAPPPPPFRKLNVTTNNNSTRKIPDMYVYMYVSDQSHFGSLLKWFSVKIILWRGSIWRGSITSLEGSGRLKTSKKLYVVHRQRYGATKQMVWTFIESFHTLIPIAWLADGDYLMCCIVMMGRQIAKMFYTFSLWGKNTV